MHKSKFSGYRIVAICFLFTFVHMGALNSLGVFSPAIARGNGFSPTQVSLMFSWAGIGAVLTGMFITPAALKKLGPKRCMLGSTILTAGHLLWYSVATHLAAFYISAVFGGVAIGLGLYAATGAIAGNWFIRNRMTVLGVISAGSGLGSAAFNAGAGAGIAAFGYKTTYIILSAVVFVLGVLMQSGIREHPSDVGQAALGAGHTDAGDPVLGKNGDAPGVAFRDAVKTPSFYLAFIAGIFGCVAWTGINMYLVTLLSSNYGLPIHIAARYDALLRVCVAIALFFSGRIAEKLGIKHYIISVGIIFSLALLMIVVTGQEIVNVPILLAVTLVLLCAGGSHSSSICQVLSNGIFGPRDFSTIQTYLIPSVNCGLAIAAFVAAPFVGPNGSTLGCFGLFLGCSVVWLILTYMSAALSPYKDLAADACKDSRV